MTSRIDRQEMEIIGLDYEDYHWEVAMNAISALPLKNSAHPGGLTKREINEPIGLSVTAAAGVLV